MMTGIGRLILIWAALLVLLAATVAASAVLHGAASLTASLLIAAIKAGLIFWFFMHLGEEAGLVRVMALGAIAWLGILFALSGADYATRGWW
ncbi:cytochrome C oxidase subunit IV family protein [Tistrella mobilis]|jgi:cytochrome c oxidase subunit 4|nr:cytochrome C oxidase subunit IV family protein [Tistrella mobilis]KYO50563.1 hypothetical protein AUP44_12370 [Tistrella mobilis]MAM73824.1 caa(3)-type oxidase subunit IV [Tistrella sp.]